MIKNPIFPGMRSMAMVAGIVFGMFLAGRLAGESPASDLPEVLDDIKVPQVRWDEVPLRRVSHALAELAQEFGPEEHDLAVNIVVYDPEERDPAVTLSLRGLTLKRILELVATQAGAQLDIQSDVAILRVDAERQDHLRTEIIPVSRHTVRQLVRTMEALDGP